MKYSGWYTNPMDPKINNKFAIINIAITLNANWQVEKQSTM